MRRRMLDRLAQLNEMQAQASGDPEITTRIAQYELAFRMQASVPELTDLADEPGDVLDLYGPDARGPAASRRIACWRAGCSNAACASCSSITAAGTTTAACRPTSRARPATSTSRRPP